MIRKSGVLVIIGLLGLLPADAGASDAEFNKALNEAKCVPAQVVMLKDEKQFKVYEITCLGNPPRKIGVSCSKSTCSASPAGDETDRRATQ